VTKTNAQAPAGPNLYEQIGVRPLINAKGTYTIISGSLSLPEVKQAMEDTLPSTHVLRSQNSAGRPGECCRDLEGTNEVPSQCAMLLIWRAF
jgi:hypothetical protein